MIKLNIKYCLLPVLQGYYETTRHDVLKGPLHKGKIYVLLAITLFFLYIGCSFSWAPTDDEAVKLTKEYYLFYHEGQDVDARVVERGDSLKDVTVTR